jgi:MYXO-CTERM domain-containing protein
VFTTGSDAKYSFRHPPRIACVTARMDGFKTNTLCHRSCPNSSTDPARAGRDSPDAGPFDAGVPIDATDPGDAGLRPDAQDPGLVDGGGCCDSRSQPGGGLLLVGLVALVLRRRRV